MMPRPLSCVRAAPFARVVLASLCALAAIGCVDAVDGFVDEQPAAPEAPTVAPVDSPRRDPALLLRGTKPAGTAIRINGDEVIELDGGTDWQTTVTIEEGANRLVLVAVDALGQQSKKKQVSVTLDTAAPDGPTLEPTLARTLKDHVDLTGTKPSGALLFVNGDEAPGAAGETDFDVRLDLREGVNAIRIATVDEVGNESAVLARSIERLASLPFQVDAVPTTVTEPALTITGDRESFVVVTVNGAEPTLPDVDGQWSVALTLAPGSNTINVHASLPGEDEPSVAFDQDFTVALEFIPTAPTVDPTPPRVGGQITITGTKQSGVDVYRDNTLVSALPASTTWSDTFTPPLEGANSFTYTARSPAGQESTGVVVNLILDTVAPPLTVDAPAPDLVLGALIDVDGTASDLDPGFTVGLCVGTGVAACTLDVDFAPVAAAGGTYATTVDLTARIDLADGDPADLVVRATDTVGNQSVVTVPFLVSRAEVLPGCSVPSAFELAATAPFTVALVCSNAVTTTLRTNAGPPWAPTSDALDADPPVVATGAGALALDAAGAGFAVTLEESPFTTATAGNRGAVARAVDLAGGGAVGASELVLDGDVDDVEAVDVALLSNGEPIVALLSADVVSVTFRTSGVWSAPTPVSDATTVLARAPQIVVGDDDAVTVAWIETSDRDGTADDEDVVAVRTDVTGAPLDTIVLVTTDSGAFTDGATVDALSLVALPGAAHEVAVAFIDTGDVWVARARNAPLALDAIDAALTTGNALDASITLDGGELLLGVIDGVTVKALAGPAFTVTTLLATGGAPPVRAAPGHVGYAHGANIAVRALVEAP